MKTKVRTALNVKTAMKVVARVVMVVVIGVAAIPQQSFGQWTINGSTIFPTNGANVGIGVGTANVKLEVVQNGAIKVGQAYLSSGGNYALLANNAWYNGSTWQTTGPGATIELGGLNGQEMRFYRQSSGVNTQSMIMDASGNVGIGIPTTSTVAAKLELVQNTSFKVGQGYMSSGGNFLHLANNEWYNGTAWVGTGTAGALIQVTGQNIMFHRHNGSGGHQFSAMIDANGNMGIGTSVVGSYKLAVEGKIGAREVNVTTGAWSDFVFKDDYKLRPLGEVEKFIGEHKHLPEVPSEAEVKANGVNLGETQALLLQKVEELTLYLIEQNKKLDVQNGKLTEQNKKLDVLTKENEVMKTEGETMKHRIIELESKEKK